MGRCRGRTPLRIVIAIAIVIPRRCLFCPLRPSRVGKSGRAAGQKKPPVSTRCSQKCTHDARHRESERVRERGGSTYTQVALVAPFPHLLTHTNARHGVSSSLSCACASSSSPAFPRPSPCALVALIAPLPRVLQPKTPQTAAATTTAQLPPHPIHFLPPRTLRATPNPRPRRRRRSFPSALRARAPEGALPLLLLHLLLLLGARNRLLPPFSASCGTGGGGGGAPAAAPSFRPKKRPPKRPAGGGDGAPAQRRRRRAGIAAEGALNNAPQRPAHGARTHTNKGRAATKGRGPNPRPAAMYPGVGTSGTNRPSAKGSYT